MITELDQYNRTSRERVVNALDISLYVVALVLWGVVLWYAYDQMMPRAQFGILFVGGVFTVYIFDSLKYAVRENDVLDIALLIVSQVITVVVTIYMVWHFDVLIDGRVGYALPHEYALISLFTLVMLYLTYKSFGTVFLGLVVGGLAYGYFGDMIPGILGHGGMSEARILLLLGLDLGGFYGFLTQLVAAWIALFLLYAGFLKAYGAYDLILQLAVKSTKYVSTGVAQTAVIASAIIGSVNGSHTANAGMTGSFTIPVMKKNGIEPKTAAGIEATASTIGQVLPPVMGAGAFIMASLIGISYVDVLIAGLLPAAIITVAVLFAVHQSTVEQLTDTEVEIELAREKLTRAEMVGSAFMYGIPFVVLIFALGVLGWTVMTSALYTVTSMFVLGLTVPLLTAAVDGTEDASVGSQLIERLKLSVEGAKDGAILIAPIAIILAAINGIVDIFLASGVPGAISLGMMSLSGGSLIAAAVMAFAICIVLGLGMPTSAAYTLVGLLIAPTLINNFFLPDLSAHYFVFYVTILAGITPPIATAAAVTAGIAGAKFFATCFEAIKISAPLYIIPFVFIWQPELVSDEIGMASIVTSVLVLFGAMAVAYGINRTTSASTYVNWSVKGVITVSGVLIMIHPSTTLKLVLIAIAFSLMIARSKRQATRDVTPVGTD